MTFNVFFNEKNFFLCSENVKIVKSTTKGLF